MKLNLGLSSYGKYSIGFGPKRGEGKGTWIKLGKEKLRDVFSSSKYYFYRIKYVFG
jgi:hypothetical protein